MSNPKTCKSCNPQTQTPMPPPPMPTQQQTPSVEITAEEKQELSRLQERCYRGLHRPMVVKVDGVNEIWYVCEKCLDKWMKKHEHLKEIVTGFKR